MFDYRDAMYEGLRSFCAVGTLSTLLVIGTVRLSPSMARNLSTSGRVATSLMPPAFAYVVSAEKYTTGRAKPDSTTVKTEEILPNRIQSRILVYYDTKYDFIPFVAFPTLISVFAYKVLKSGPFFTFPGPKLFSIVTFATVSQVSMYDFISTRKR